MGIETVVLVLYVTAYRSVPAQTDSSPNWTSIGQYTHTGGIAVSQDLLSSGKVKYGDYLCVDGLGCYHVNDCMAPRHVNAADVWVVTKEQEARIKPGKRQVLRVRGRT